MCATDAPPAKYSVSQKDFDPDIGARLLIRLNGVAQRQVIEYDCEAGTLIRNKLDDGGRAQVNPDKRDEVWTEEVTGHVTVEWR